LLQSESRLALRAIASNLPAMTGEGAPTRIEAVDALRGYALLGLFLVHMVEYFELYWADPKPSAVHDVVFALFAGKTFSLLALCFGFSFWVMMDRAAARGGDFSLRFAWRLTLLAAIGWLHALFYRGDIITVLALAGFVLIPLNRIRSAWALALLAGFFFLQPLLILRLLAAMRGEAWALQPPNFFTDPYMPVYLTGSFADMLSVNAWAGQASKFWYYFETGRISQIFGLFLAGLILGRNGFFADPGRFRRAHLAALACAVLAAAAIIFGRAGLADALGLAAGDPARRAFDMLLASWQDLALTATSALLLLLLWQTGLQALLRLLVPVGRMTLSFYVGQSLVFVPIFYGFGLGLYRDITQAEALGLGIAAFLLQAIVARLWLARFAYGPLEWLWRALTFLSLDVPFRRRVPAPSA
jgi:uncharacterized protein